MKLLNIFKAGTHTAANGTDHTITVDDLQKAADLYSADLHEAPIVVGHPTDNGPAYGWIKGLTVTNDGNFEAEPDQVDEQFAELVEKGRFKKISASFYPPESPANPTPGSYYLRHVGFLGAQPPAVKGLRDAAFNEADDEYIEFEDPWDKGTAARLWRGIRDMLLGNTAFTKDEVDQAIPGYAVEDLENSARVAIDIDLNNPLPAFTEGNSMTEEELKLAQEKLDKEKADFAEQQTKLTTDKADFAEKAKAAKAVEIKGFVDDQIKAGKVKPAERDDMIAFMETLEANSADFGEGDKATNTLDFYKAQVEALPVLVDFKEHSKDDGHTDDGKIDAVDLSERAIAHRQRRAADGTIISASQAVSEVQAGKDKA